MSSPVILLHPAAPAAVIPSRSTPVRGAGWRPHAMAAIGLVSIGFWAAIAHAAGLV